MAGALDILVVAGARPNFMKIAPIMRALADSKILRGRLIHTGQHHDDAMSGSFFRELGIPEPEENLEAAGGTQASQTAEIMIRFEKVMDRMAPRAVLVVGDVTSTLACALVAVKKGVPVIHVESGLRSYDRAMPEEINRVLTDQISDFLFTTEREADENLAKEGITKGVHFVGNVMVDSIEHNLKNATPAVQTLSALGVKATASNYAVLTLHRPSNVDDPKMLEALLGAIAKIAAQVPVLFPAHPRTKDAIARFGLERYFESGDIAIVPPQSYLSMLGLMREAKIVLTDSGGLQEETTALGVPCFTLRENTERWITVTQGTNTMVGTSPDALLDAFADLMAGKVKGGVRPEAWDGRAGERIVAILEKALAK